MRSGDIVHYRVEKIQSRGRAWRYRGEPGRVEELIGRAYERFPVLGQRRRQAAGTLSGGQQRQLEIARSLMHDPALFLIDEPTAKLLADRDIWWSLQPFLNDEDAPQLPECH